MHTWTVYRDSSVGGKGWFYCKTVYYWAVIGEKEENIATDVMEELRQYCENGLAKLTAESEKMFEVWT